MDIFKLEPPGPIHRVPEPDGAEAAELQGAYDEMAAMLPRPWVMLSAGAGAADFTRSLHYAYRAGAAGYLAGRAIWSEAFARFPDYAAMEALLATDSQRVLGELNALTDAAAAAWREHPGYGGAVEADVTEGVFPRGYG